MSIKTPTLSAGRPSARKAALSMADKEIMVRINVELPEAARAKIKMHALKNKATISDLIRQYIDSLPG